MAGTLDTQGLALSIAVDGNLAYLADGPGGLVVVDIANPGDLREVSRLRSGESAHDLAIGNGHAFVAAGRRALQVVDVGTPSTPRLASIYIRHSPEADISGLAVVGAYLYTGTGTGICVYDVADPVQPRLVFEPETDDTAIFDVTDPTAPVLIDKVTYPGKILDLAVSGNIAFAANWLLGGGCIGVHALVLRKPARIVPWLGSRWCAAGSQCGEFSKGQRTYHHRCRVDPRWRLAQDIAESSMALENLPDAALGTSSTRGGWGRAVTSWWMTRPRRSRRPSGRCSAARRGWRRGSLPGCWPSCGGRRPGHDL